MSPTAILKSSSIRSPTRASLRALLRHVAIGDTDLHMLCLDHLPEMMAYLGRCMTYNAMLNAVLERIEPIRLLEAMERCEGFAAGMARNRHLLVFESTIAPVSGPAAHSQMTPPPPKSAYDPAWYLERPAEQERARAALAAPGSPVVLQAPELFGKTWLLVHLLAELQERGRTVYIHLKSLGEESVSNFSTFLRELGRLLLENCSLPAALLEQAWARSNNPAANWNWLMATHVLPSSGDGRWLVLALDGADAIAEQAYFDRFLTLMRGMAEAAAFPPWGVLRLILTLSSTIALRGQDIHRSPLENVAQIIPLTDLATDQVAQFASWYGCREQTLQTMLDQVGGHPYLVHLSLYEAQHRKLPLSEVLAAKSRIFEPYLQMCRKRLLQQPELYQAFRSVIIDGINGVDDSLALRLVDAGFLRDDYDENDSRVLRLRYNLYRRLA